MGPQLFSPFPVEYPPFTVLVAAQVAFNVTPRKPECTDKVKKSKWISCRSVFLHTDNLSVTRAKIIFFRFFLPMHFAPRAELKYFHGPLYEPELIDWGDRWFEVVTEGGQGVPCGEWRQDMSCIRGDIVETSQCRRWLLWSLRGKLRKLHRALHWNIRFWV